MENPPQCQRLPSPEKVVVTGENHDTLFNLLLPKTDISSLILEKWFYKDQKGCHKPAISEDILM